jgi:pimeloyl-ACP methyl ester carboxylesterase
LVLKASVTGSLFLCRRPDSFGNLRALVLQHYKLSLKINMTTKQNFRYALALGLIILPGILCAQKPTATALNFDNITYPFPVKYITLRSQRQEVKMAYMDLKPETPNGKTVLLLHGKNFFAAYWEKTARDLAGRGYRVVMPDQVGFGKSSKPEHYQYTFQILAQHTKAVLDALGITRVHVLGHSMGGMLAVRFTLMYPDITQKLVLENPLGLEDWKLKVPYQSVDNWYQGELKKDYNALKKYQQTSYYNNTWNAEYERWLAPVAGWTLNTDYARIAWTSALTYDMIFTQPVCYEFEHIEIPVLLIIGLRDRTAIGKDKAPAEVAEALGDYPQLGKETARKMKQAMFIGIDNVGHLPHIEAYDQFIQPLLAFLQ